MKIRYFVYAMLALTWCHAFGSETPIALKSAQVAANVDENGSSMVIEARGLKPKAPVFFSADAVGQIRLVDGLAPTVEQEFTVRIKILQGVAETVTLSLNGEGELEEVSGERVASWAVRVEGTPRKRMLEIRLTPAEAGADSSVLNFKVRALPRPLELPVDLKFLTLGPGQAAGFNLSLTVTSPPGFNLRFKEANGLVPLRANQQFVSGTDSSLIGTIGRSGVIAGPIELSEVSLEGTADEASGSIQFVLTGQAQVRDAGARLTLLGGNAALSELPADAAYRVKLEQKGHPLFKLEFPKAGTFPIRIPFAARIASEGDLRSLDFRVATGGVVPVVLKGFRSKVEFQSDHPVVPQADGAVWRGFLPVTGQCAIAWKNARASDDGRLFFESIGQVEISVGAGLLREQAVLDLRVLQGQLDALNLGLDGAGEILAVEGPNVVSWNVSEVEKGKRRLNVQLSRPITTQSKLTIRSQQALAEFPVQTRALRITPEGGVRHSGWIRVSNEGAVRLEISGLEGLTQLAPEQWPGAPAAPEARQISVYRFPAAQLSFEINADQILPRTLLTQVLVYDFGETDRVIQADLELDIREAPLREFEIQIPDGYAVAAATGAEIKDYVLATEAVAGKRGLKVSFSKPVLGRQLIQLRLEHNEAAKPGLWTLPVLGFPQAESMRGFVGISATAGFRLTPEPISPAPAAVPTPPVPPTAPRKLVEVPLNLFPSKVPRLQQAFRIRESDWATTVRIEATGQSVQADVFHLYSLKQGMIYGSVLVNYFVVGAPVSEWRLRVPSTAGNLAVDAVNMRNWRREGDEVIITLNQPALGASTLLLAFEEPMSSRGGIFNAGTVQPIGAEAERGFIHVVSSSQVSSEVRKASEGLLRLEPAELPSEFRVLSASPSLAVYQYPARPFALEMSVNWFEPAETVEQVIDFARLQSQVARDGQMVTEATYFVKTRGLKALRLKLPVGAQLWEAKAGGETVNPRRDGEITLIPLPAQNDPNEPVQVALRYGEKAKEARNPILHAPDAQCPGMTMEWHASADRGRMLVPVDGNLRSPRRVLTETGFEWLRFRASRTLLLLLGLCLVLAFGLRRRSASSRFGKLFAWFAALGWLGTVLFALLLMTQAFGDRRMNVSTLELIAAVTGPGEVLSATIRNIPIWEAMLSWMGILLAVCGVALIVFGKLTPPKPLRSGLGWALLGMGLLAQSGGAALFFGLLLGALGLCLIRDLRSTLKIRTPSAAALGLLLGLCSLLNASAEVAPQISAVPPVPPVPPIPPVALHREPVLESLEQKWRIEKNRVFASARITLDGQPTDAFFLLQGPAVLTSFQGDGVRLSKRPGVNGEQLILVPERTGRVTATILYEIPLGESREAIGIPTGPAAVHAITLEMDQAGWGFSSPQGIRTEAVAGLARSKSGARLILGAEGDARIVLEPKRRDLEAEATQFYAETRSLMVPSPGVIDGIHQVTIRPSQGRVSQLEITIPKGFSVGNVTDRPVWRFDPESRRLRIQIEPSQSEPFTVAVETQRSVGGLPFESEMEPIRILGAAGDVGTFAVGFGPDAQAAKVEAGKMQAVNLEDFALALPPGVTLQRVFRYGAEGGAVRVKAVPVAPEIRVETVQTLSLGEERLSLSIDAKVNIARAGVFNLSFPLPEGLELEALTGPALSHWSEVNENGVRIIRLHLNGRTIGAQIFSLSFTGIYPGKQAGWKVPRFSFREADRQTGDLLITPERGVQIRAVQRESVSQVEVPAIGKQRPGAAAFRLLQANWTLALGVEELEPWVTAQMLHEGLLREGQTRHRIALRYRVENAAVKALRIKLPGLDAEAARTVRATGRAVSDIVAIEADLWEIRFQRSMVGETDVEIEYQVRSDRPGGREVLAMAQPENVKQLQAYAAIRGGGRLEFTAGGLPGGWQRADWQTIPPELQNPRDRSVPALVFRVTEPGQVLGLNVRRNEVENTLKLAITRAIFTSVLTSSGAVLTGVELSVSVVEKGTMRVELPAEATLFSVTVNGESAAVVKEAEACLFHVAAGANDEPAQVRLVYSERKGTHTNLVAPRFHVPLENLQWDVIVPEGYILKSHHGDLELTRSGGGSGFAIDDYLNLSRSTRAGEQKKATTLIEQANVWMKSGQQDKARKALSQASRNSSLDAASNEDARIQLLELQTRQAVIGLNTRRQKVILDNRSPDAAADPGSTPVPQSAEPAAGTAQQFQQALQGNSAQENEALRRMAARIVGQQLAAEPAPQAIMPTLPKRGELCSFTRGVQVDGTKALTLELELQKIGLVRWWFPVVCLFTLAGLVTVLRVRPRA